MKRRPLPGLNRRATYGNVFRAKRLTTFMHLVDDVLARSTVCKILDVGGDERYWLELAEVWESRNLAITLVNTDAANQHDGRFTVIRGNACDLSEFPDKSFDVVHSNSVIEHVGDWPRKRLMANEIRRLADAYFVQTPNYWFPYEPHLRVPLIHWMPPPWRSRIVMARSCGYYPRAANVDQAYDVLSDASLIDAQAMRSLFPEAQLMRERFGPLTKSLIAFRRIGAPA